MKLFKKFSAFALIIAVVFSLVTLCGCEEEKLKPTEKFFVNDFANCIDDETETVICQKGEALQSTTGAQAVVVTVESVSGEISDYATELGREWKLGEKDKNNGALILLSVNDRQIYVAVGYGLEGALNDSKVGRLIDNYALSDLKNDDYQKGLASLYDAVVNETYIEYGIEVPDTYVPASELKVVEEESNPWVVIISWLILLVVVILYTFFFRRRGIMLMPFINIGGYNNNNFRGGGFGGGFGGFSGGGGSFGGGGAGRGF